MNDYKSDGAKTAISYEDARQQCIEAVRKVNPKCSAQCLQAQLDSYYQDKLGCKENSQLKPNLGKAEPKVPAQKPKVKKTAGTD